MAALVFRILGRAVLTLLLADCLRVFRPASDG